MTSVRELNDLITIYNISFTWKIIRHINIRVFAAVAVVVAVLDEMVTKIAVVV